MEVAGTHEAIIDYETFENVESFFALLQRDTRRKCIDRKDLNRELHLFSGFLK